MVWMVHLERLAFVPFVCGRSQKGGNTFWGHTPGLEAADVTLPGTRGFPAALPLLALCGSLERGGLFPVKEGRHIAGLHCPRAGRR